MKKNGHLHNLLKYMLTHSKITTFEAFNKLHNTRLSEYIRQLRHDYNIVIDDKPINKRNIYGNSCTFFEFWINENSMDNARKLLEKIER